MSDFSHHLRPLDSIIPHHDSPALGRAAISFRNAKAWNRGDAARRFYRLPLDRHLTAIPHEFRGGQDAKRIAIASAATVGLVSHKVVVLLVFEDLFPSSALECRYRRTIVNWPAGRPCRTRQYGLAS